MVANREELAPIIERIRKLLALGTSSNEHEAALAVSNAQRLLQKYDLSMESIENLQADKRTAVRKGEKGVVSTTEGKPDGWKAELFEAVAFSHDCFTAYSTRWETTWSGKYRSVREGQLIGFGHDVEMAGYELNFLISEIERLAQEYADTMWAEIRKVERLHGITHQQAERLYVQDTGRHPLKAKLYFIRGAAEVVDANLRQGYYDRQYAAKNDNPHALVLRKREAVEDFLYVENYGMTKAEYYAKREAESAVRRAEREAVTGEVESAADRKLRLEREAKEKAKFDRWLRNQARKHAREEARKYAATDHEAVRAGREAGRAVTPRRGIGEGDNGKEQIG